MRSGLLLALMLAASSSAASDTPLTIDQLLAQGWEIAGYASGYDNRTSLILFATREYQSCLKWRHHQSSNAKAPTSSPFRRTALSAGSSTIAALL